MWRALVAAISGVVVLAALIAVALAPKGESINRPMLDTYTIAQRTKDLDGHSIEVSTAQNPKPPEQMTHHTTVSFAAPIAPQAEKTYDEQMPAKTDVVKHLQDEVSRLERANSKLRRSQAHVTIEHSTGVHGTVTVV